MKNRETIMELLTLQMQWAALLEDPNCADATAEELEADYRSLSKSVAGWDSDITSIVDWGFTTAQAEFILASKKEGYNIVPFLYKSNGVSIEVPSIVLKNGVMPFNDSGFILEAEKFGSSLTQYYVK
jgi:hypothetical protein